MIEARYFANLTANGDPFEDSGRVLAELRRVRLRESTVRPSLGLRPD
jgi:hypothetical protein